jgi:hypothetical protein
MPIAIDLGSVEADDAGLPEYINASNTAKHQ